MSEHQQLFWQIALVGPAVFFSSAFSEEELASRFTAPTSETARDFLVLRTLAEVQKYGAAARRWRAEENRHSSGDRFDALVAESLLVERVAWQRRLLEALVTLINFSTTNQNEYFAHFLAVQEYERERYWAADERDFFGAESELTEKRLCAVQRLVDSARARLPMPADCWYLRFNDAHKTSSLRHRYLRAMRDARSSEKTALGYTYQLSFGAASERLHFGVLDHPADSKLGSRVTDALCGLLATAIICRAHDLCGIEPRGINKSIMQPAIRDRSVSQLLSTRAEVGDFVLVAGPHLGEVLEIRRGQFDYESYRVGFLDVENGPGLREGWLPAPAVGLFMKCRDLIRDVQTCFAEDAESEFIPTDEDLRESTRAAVLESWRLGIREYISRQIEKPMGEDTQQQLPPGPG
jgi:hypothetical protein